MAAVEVLTDPRVARHVPSPPSIDARPALPISTSGDSLWDRAAQRRDWVSSYISSFFKSRGIEAWVRESQPGEYPLFVAVDSWMPVGQTDTFEPLDRCEGNSLAASHGMPPATGRQSCGPQGSYRPYPAPRAHRGSHHGWGGGAAPSGNPAGGVGEVLIRRSR